MQEVTERAWQNHRIEELVIYTEHKLNWKARMLKRDTFIKQSKRALKGKDLHKDESTTKELKLRSENWSAEEQMKDEDKQLARSQSQLEKLTKKFFNLHTKLGQIDEQIKKEGRKEVD